MKQTFFLLLFIISTSLSAQYTKVINSKRPGFSESPYGVGTRVYQIEGGFFYQKSNEETATSLQKSLGSDVFLRAGLLSEKLEFNLGLKYQKDELHKLDYTPIDDNDPYFDFNYNRSGISQFTFGAKYLIYMPTYKDPSKEIRSWKKKMAFDKKRLIPAVGIYAGLNTNFLSDDYKLPQMSPKAAILLQNDFSDYLIWVNNIVGDNLTLKDYRTYGYISTLTYSITDRFSVFGEHQGMFKPNNINEFKLGGGMAYLTGLNTQIGLNMHWDMKMDHLNLYGGVGASWRLDRHKEYKVAKPKGKDGSGKIQRKEGGLLKNLFRKKNKRRTKRK
jgi:hypothetical protein